MEKKGTNDDVLVLENEFIVGAEPGGEDAVRIETNVLLLTNAIEPEHVVKKIDVGPRIFRSIGPDASGERNRTVDRGFAPAWTIIRSKQSTGESVSEAARSPVYDLQASEQSKMGGAMELNEMLAEARACANEYCAMNARTRKALYAALGQTYDLTFYADSWPGEYARLLEETGLTLQNRAPYSPIVKLVFGADYDKKRVTEFAAAIIYGRRKNLAAGSFADYLNSVEGGLKAVVGFERLIRKGEDNDCTNSMRAETRPAIARKLREISPRSWTDLRFNGDEFALLLARRLPDGSIAMVGEVPRDIAMLEKAARKLLANVEHIIEDHTA